MKAIDCASKLTEASIEHLKASGVQAIGRYLGPEISWKTVNRAEVAHILSAGLKLFSIWEKNPVSSLYFTRDQGAKDAKEAVHFASGIGQPAGTPIYFTVDYDATNREMDLIINYFRSIKSVISTYKVGVYGSFAVIEVLVRSGAADFFYQTYAWSRGKLSAYAHIYQHDNGRKMAGILVDFDNVLKPSGIWGSIAATKADSVDLKRKAARPDSIQQSTIVPYPGQLIRRGSKGKDIVSIQNAVGVRADGIFGLKTEQAVINYQKRHDLIPDGIVGPKTWSVMF
ncbi:glycoside hydrolase domain-containing protein [Sporolactobacillus pectinivorans]|uniref:glycoside hydrolase domain-containing protein n=1 Tax=Sporolactobacillus pectinivorans TaxID=1591408 RepID=UPI000C25FA19|nr:glycoside hydrolase domain-containing protein [Sporolactobacillus pectinivorans]